MSPQKEDEPVAYLGGKAGEPDGEIEGYLGGDAPPDSLPALPPASTTGQYSASDFIAPPPEIEDEAPPPADQGDAPAEDPAYFQQYAQDEPPTDPSTATVADAPQEQTSEFDEPGLPKTISQQDAENIIKRITTKKILPPDVAASEGPRVSSQEHTPRRGLRLGPVVVLLAIVLGGVGFCVAEPDIVGPYLPEWMWPWIRYEPPKPPEVTPSPVANPEMLKEKAMRDVVLESEWRAFGFESKEAFEQSNQQLKGGPKKDAPPGSNQQPGGGETPGNGGGK